MFVRAKLTTLKEALEKMKMKGITNINVLPNYRIWKSRFPNLTKTHVYRTLRVGDKTAVVTEMDMLFDTFTRNGGRL